MKPVGILAGAGRMPELGVAAARTRGHDVVLIDVGPEPNASLSAAGFAEHVPIWQYGRIVDAFIERGVRDVYLLGKIDPAVVTDERLDEAALRVLATVEEKTGRGLIAAFIKDLASHGLRVRSQVELFDALLVDGSFSVGAERLSPAERRDVLFGYDTACALAEHVNGGQTAVVKRGLVLALEAAEGTDATIRRGGELGGAGTIIAKVKGRRGTEFDLPVVGPDTVQAAIDVAAAALVVEANNVILLEREAVIEAAREGGVALVAVTERERT